ncbi:MAG: hypothetical protein IJQ02_11815 [Oscillospiraceae bacterium]|nr:hypothetical protein [Oscillospiraceae bacterium]
MKCLERNKQAFWYCRYLGKEPILDEDGKETAEYRLRYDSPVRMRANISPAAGRTDRELFGNLESYDKVIVSEDMNCPIDEQTVLFVDGVPEFNRAGDPLYDYVVRRVARSLNVVSIAISKVQSR